MARKAERIRSRDMAAMDVCMTSTTAVGQEEARSGMRCMHAPAWQRAAVRHCMGGPQSEAPKEIQA
jgi:hypothetical protein